MTIRVCPKRDAQCPHGLNCPYVIDEYNCKDEDNENLGYHGPKDRDRVAVGMIERVARAIREADRAEGLTFTDLTRAMARAAIAAMREPTEEMLEAAREENSLSYSLEPGEGQDWDPTEDMWQAMIDAALKEASL